MGLSPRELAQRRLLLGGWKARSRAGHALPRAGPSEGRQQDRHGRHAESADALARRYSGKPEDEVLRAVNKELPGLDRKGAAEIAHEISQGNRVKFRAT